MIKTGLIKLQTSNLRRQLFHNEPIFYFAKKIDQIKGTLGITG
jgi:hypothetical protein